MKKFSSISTILIIAAGIVVTAFIGTEPSSIKSVGNAQSEHDTTGLLKFVRSEPFNLEIIPPSSGVQFYGNGILFLSNTKYEAKMLAKHVSFGSIEAYTAPVKDSVLGVHTQFSPEESFSFPCEATTFTSDLKKMYFTKIGKKEKKEKIYTADYKTGPKGTAEWISEDMPLAFCTGDHIFTHPAISSDGKRLIFASDMEGSFGGMDLFITEKEGDNWSAPRNLGKRINTVMDECFPYLDNDNNLYFSSDGLPGFGGYDIFTCKANGDSWDRPLNLSKKINSVNDDIAFKIDKITGDYGFYTTRKQGSTKGMKLSKVYVIQEGRIKNPLTITEIFNGQPVPATEMVAAKPKEEAKPAPAEPAKNETALQTIAEEKKEIKPEVKKDSPESAPKPQNAKFVTIKNTSELPAELKDKVIYRVQFYSSGKPRKENTVLFNGVSYKTYEYFYLNLYRYTAGEFTTLSPAKALQEIIRKSGYPDAFVAAFKNDMRALDLTLFK
jgi:hypothetical protein